MINQSKSNSRLIRHLAWPLTLCALAITAGCGGMPLTQKISNSESHIDAQAIALDAANQHLQEAQNRLENQPDPHHAGPELKQGVAGVQNASAINTQIRQDMQSLAGTAQSLQTQIDKHQNDWLGPRTRRLRNHLLIAFTVLMLGAVLLWLGPMLGGPIGGIAIVAGHLLTVFAVPIWKIITAGFWVVWNWLTGKSKSIVALLSTLGGELKPAESTPTTGVTHAATGSD